MFSLKFTVPDDSDIMIIDEVKSPDRIKEVVPPVKVTSKKNTRSAKKKEKPQRAFSMTAEDISSDDEIYNPYTKSKLSDSAVAKPRKLSSSITSQRTKSPKKSPAKPRAKVIGNADLFSHCSRPLLAERLKTKL